jgi:hypothetical protein
VLDGLSFGVRSTQGSFLELARPYLAPFAAEPEPGADVMRFSADCGVERTLPGGVRVRGVNTLYRDAVAVFRGRDRREMLARLISSARDVATSHSNQFVRIRAGAAAVGDAAVVLPSDPEPHLSALVGSLAARGAGYLGDELVNLDPILRRVHGVALPLLLDTADLDLFPPIAERPTPGRRRASAPRRAASRAITPRWPASVEELGGRPAEPAPIGWIVFPTFEPGARTELRPTARAEALFRFTRSCLNLNVWGERALILMRELLESTPTAELVVGSIPEAADLLLRSAPSRARG